MFITFFRGLLQCLKICAHHMDSVKCLCKSCILACKFVIDNKKKGQLELSESRRTIDKIQAKKLANCRPIML